MTQAETACPDVWGSHFLEYRGRLLALARRNLNPVLARRVSAEDVVQEALLAACGKMVFFENNPEIPVYFKLRMILFQTLTAMERKHLQCLKRDACREVNVTDDSVGSAARLDWNRFADTVTGLLPVPSGRIVIHCSGKRSRRCPKTIGRFLNSAILTTCPMRIVPKSCILGRKPQASAMCGRCSGFGSS